MLSDRRHPCFRNFDSVVSIDVIRMKSYLDSLFETSRSISQSDSIVRQTNKRSFLSDTTMNNIHIFNDIKLSCLTVWSLYVDPAGCQN